MKTRLMCSLLLSCPLAALAGNDEIGALVKALKDPSPQVRWQAAEDLGQLGARAKDSIPALIEATKDKHPCVRGRALNALSFIPAQPKIVVPVLVRALKETANAATPGTKGSIEVGEIAAFSLANIGPKARPAVPALLQMLDERGMTRRNAAIYALGRIAGDEPKTIARLLDLLKRDPDLAIRSAAGSALGRIGPPAKEAVPELIRLLQLPAEEHMEGARAGTVISAAIALGNMGEAARPAVPALARIVVDYKPPDQGQHVYAANALAKLGPVAKEAVPALMTVLKRTFYDEAVFKALAAIGQDAIPPLVQLFPKGTVQQRRNALKVFGLMGPAARDALPVVRQACQDPFLRTEATRALARIESKKQQD